jgi:hypothetical protein
VALLTLDEAKTQLDIDSTAHDAELTLYIEALTPVIESYIGPVEDQTFTEQADAHGGVVCLNQTPVLAITSMAPALTGGQAYTPDLLHVDSGSGVVRLLSGGSLYGGPWTITYTAGRGEVPATVKLAALILLQHLWRTQNGAARGASPADDYAVTEPVPGFGYAVPNRVLQLLEPYKRGPGIG